VLKTRVIKIGGNELERPDWLERCAAALSTLQPVVIVHGGGKAVDELSRRLGLPVDKREGLRVTTPEIAAVVEMTLTGPVSRSIVLALRRAGVDAVGLSGADGGLLRARQSSLALGHVGEIVEVRRALLESLLLAGLTPVIAPVAPPPDGSPIGVPLNINADSAAAAVAGALGAAELLFVSDVPGVEINGETQKVIEPADIEGLVASGAATGGMVAKLRAAARALSQGVRAARIGDLDILRDSAAGTRLLNAAALPA
jgi:acetylglutamate kinase